MTQPPIDWRLAVGWAIVVAGIAVFWALVATIALVIICTVPVV